MEFKCEDCKFWDRQNCSSEKGIGSCRKLPPIVKVDDYGNDYWHWPITCSGDWCGEFQAKEVITSPMLISDFDWSFRARQCLRKAGIETINELTQKTPYDLLKIRNFGFFTLKEVVGKLNTLDLTLKIPTTKPIHAYSKKVLSFCGFDTK